MCLDNKAETHRCINDCPICYILIPENLLQLLSGATLNLGKLDLFVEIAGLGCRMCETLCNMWQLNDELFQPGSEVSVKRDTATPDDLLWALMFEISEPIDERFSKGTGWYQVEKFKSWAVPFGIYTKGSGSLDHIITIKPSDPSVSRDAVFDTFKTCLTTCLSSHKECQQPQTAQLPARLLRLDDTGPDIVSLHKCESDEQVRYVALSYCWGTSMQTRLLKSNIDEFSRNGIEVRNLPKTIADSIIATRKLGMRYLWIDSLCIIQDSPEDKDKEIVNMANIYKNATITISAAAATDCEQGFLEDRPDVQLRHDRSMCLPFLSEADENSRGVIDWIYLCPDPHMGHKVKRFSEEAINSRAWTYQESTLASRLLIFGSGPPQWHCKENWQICGLNIHPLDLPQQECCSSTQQITIKDGETIQEESFQRIERQEPLKDDIGTRLTWFPVLEDYSRRALSYRTDKLLALSALAAEYQSARDETYAAGLWRASLPRGLLWRRIGGKTTPSSQIRQNLLPLSWLYERLFSESPSIKPSELIAWPVQYVVPSWSPMSSTDAICFESASTQEENQFHTSLVEVNHVHTDHSNNINPFGKLNFSYLDLTGPMCSVSWKDLTANFIVVEDGEPFLYWDWIMLDDPAFFETMRARYEPSFNPQLLADRNVQNPMDEDEVRFRLSGAETRLRMPIVPEPASRECQDVSTPFIPILDVKQMVFDSLKRRVLIEKSGNVTKSSANMQNECEFWLLEVERSMSPSGLVLKNIEGDIFARVGYFVVNSNLDPETVCLPGPIQVRGRKIWRWSDSESKSTWNGLLKRKRIYLV